MTQPDFAYGPAGVGSGARTLSLFADRPHLRTELHHDAVEAGFSVLHAGPLADLAGSRSVPMGHALVVDCPVPGEEAVAALSRADDRVSRTAGQLIVSTTMDALDGVFASCRSSGPQILVNPSHADRVLALGRVLATGAGGKVREMNEADRLTLLRLTEQVGQIAARLDTFGGSGAGEYGATLPDDKPAPGGLSGSAFSFGGAVDRGSDALVRDGRPGLPDARLIRRIIRHRQLRRRFFEGDLFADPAWDILLDLTAARAEQIRVSVSSLCIASGVPPTTALRWITQMTESGLLQRIEDESDRRRVFIALTDTVSEAIARYFAEIGKDTPIV